MGIKYIHKYKINGGHIFCSLKIVAWEGVKFSMSTKKMMMMIGFVRFHDFSPFHFLVFLLLIATFSWRSKSRGKAELPKATTSQISTKRSLHPFSLKCQFHSPTHIITLKKEPAFSFPKFPSLHPSLSFPFFFIFKF